MNGGLLMHRLQRGCLVVLGLVVLAGAIWSVSVWLEIRPLLARAGAAGGAATTEAVSYRGEAGAIAAELRIPAGKPRAYVVFAHGNRPAGRRHPLPQGVMAVLGGEYVVLGFDFRGYGESEPLSGYRPGMTMDFTDDVVQGVHYLAQRFGVDPRDVVLIGHSFGSVSVTLAGRRLGSRRVVPLGTGDPERIFESPSGIRQQRAKLALIGLDVPTGDVAALYAPLYARNLYGECFPGIMMLVSGRLDGELATLRGFVDGLNARCPRRVSSFTVPLANHMFWSDGYGSSYYGVLRLFMQPADWSRALAGAILMQLNREPNPT